MGIVGALGKMNFTSSNFCRRRQFSARETQPAPLSPRPWAIITVAVCFLTAGTMSAVGEEGGIVLVAAVSMSMVVIHRFLGDIFFEGGSRFK
jgi:hypothetical protein